MKDVSLLPRVHPKGRWYYLVNDLRAKTITGEEESHGMQQARRMGAHSTEAQTADYVRHRKAQTTEATR